MAVRRARRKMQNTLTLPQGCHAADEGTSSLKCDADSRFGDVRRRSRLHLRLSNGAIFVRLCGLNQFVS